MAISVIIPAAGSSRVNKNLPISMIEIGDITLLQRQMFVINRFLKTNYEIIVVSGHQIEKQEKYPNVKFIEYDSYHTGNVAGSIKIGLDASKYRNVLIVYGDLFLDSNVLQEGMTSSSLVIDNGCFEQQSVGVIVGDQHIENMHYGLTPKWCQIAFFNKKELLELEDILETDKNHERYFLFEIINRIISYGGRFIPYYSRGTCVDIDSSSSLKKIKRDFNEHSWDLGRHTE